MRARKASSVLIGVVALGAVAMGQSFEVGGAIGAGTFAVGSTGGDAAGQAGVNLCIGCSGRFALFGEYRHWFTGASTGADHVKSADLGGAGLRIQSSGSRRIFFDTGLVGGCDRHADSDRSRGLGGVVVGGGIEIPVHGHWSISPQVRGYGLSPHTLEGVDAHWALGGSLGVNYRY